MPLRFSQELDAHNPNTPEWREDIGLVVTRLLAKVPRAPRPPLPQHPRAPQRSWGGGAQGGVHTAAPSHSDLAFWPAAGSPAWAGRGLRLTVTLQGRHRSCESQLLTQEQPLLPGRPESL